MKTLSKSTTERSATSAPAASREDLRAEHWSGDLKVGAQEALFPRKGIRTILVPLEVGDRGKALLRAASAWSQQLEARLVFLHVCRAIDYVPPLATAAQFEDWNAAIKAEAERKFIAMKAEFE